MDSNIVANEKRGVFAYATLSDRINSLATTQKQLQLEIANLVKVRRTQVPGPLR